MSLLLSTTGLQSSGELRAQPSCTSSPQTSQHWQRCSHGRAGLRCCTCAEPDWKQWRPTPCAEPRVQVLHRTTASPDRMNHGRPSMPGGQCPGSCWSGMHTAPCRTAAVYLEEIVRLQSVVTHSTQQGRPQLLVSQSEPGMCCRGKVLRLPLAQVCSCGRGCSHHGAAVPCAQPPAMLWLWCHHHIKAWRQHGRERQHAAAALCKGGGY